MLRRTSRILFRSDQSTPLGRISMAGTLSKSNTAEFQSMRVLGSYAIVYLFGGEGFYRDANGYAAKLQAGDLLLLFPEIAHRYGPRRGQEWQEIYAVFDGPAFDLWRAQGLYDATQPVIHLEPVKEWLERIEQVLAAPRPASPEAATIEVAQFLELLTQMTAPVALKHAGNVEPEWLARTRRLLEANLEKPIDWDTVAQDCGLTYESLRKRFREATGVSPARYRSERRIAAACALLKQEPVPIKAIATSLGFRDEFHFSRRFKEITGQTPREYRLT
jgi:AraC-like DNA-binding protein